MRALILVAVVVALIGGCPPRSAPAAVASPPRAVAPARLEVWVDASAPEGGDGTEARPYRALGAALARGGGKVRVRTGLYQGPFELPAGMAIDGPESAVLFAEGGEAAVVTAGDASLSGVTLQGGAVGLVSKGRVRAEGVHFSGQRRAAIEVRGGELELSRGDVRATVSDVLGVSAVQGRVTILDSAFSGPFRRALRAEGAGVEVTVERARFVEAVTAVHLVDARGRLRGLHARGGRGPAVFVARGEVEIDGLEVEGHEYALLSRDAVLAVRGLTSRKAERAGLALVGGRSRIEDLTVSESGGSGAVDLVKGEVTLRRFRIERVTAYAVHARSAKIAISDGEISSVAAEADGLGGDGLHLREARGAVERVSGRQLAGSGLLVAEGSEVSGTDLVLERCRWGGVVVETLSGFTGRSITARECGGAALAVPSEATATVDGLTSARNEHGAVWAECAQGARVTLRALVDDAPRPRPPCVRVER